MISKVRVFCLKSKNEFDLVKKINLFGDKMEVIATQIYQKDGEWVAFLYYKTNGETKNGK